jgi:hypothetical protein
VSNVGNEAQSIFGSNQNLQIGDKQFSANDSAAFWTRSADVELNPGTAFRPWCRSTCHRARPMAVCSRCTIHSSLVAQRVSLQQPGEQDLTPVRTSPRWFRRLRTLLTRPVLGHPQLWSPVCTCVRKRPRAEERRVNLPGDIEDYDRKSSRIARGEPSLPHLR